MLLQSSEKNHTAGSYDSTHDVAGCDPKTSSVVATIRVGPNPTDVAAGERRPTGAAGARRRFMDMGRGAVDACRRHAAADRLVRADRDRAAAAQALIAAGCDVVVCDDGLQHYRLQRDIEIEVVDGRRRYGNGHLLPAGPLREPVGRAARCDFHVLNLAADDEDGSAGAQAGFGEWPMRIDTARVVPMLGGRPQPLSTLAGQRVHAVAGIGDPQRFFASLRAHGIAVVPHGFPDHHRYEVADFEFGSDLPVLMTEKDAVKCLPFAGERYYSVPAQAELPEAFWIGLLDRLPAKATTA